MDASGVYYLVRDVLGNKLDIRNKLGIHKVELTDDQILFIKEAYRQGYARGSRDVRQVYYRAEDQLKKHGIKPNW